MCSSIFTRREKLLRPLVCTFLRTQSSVPLKLVWNARLYRDYDTSIAIDQEIPDCIGVLFKFSAFLRTSNNT